MNVVKIKIICLSISHKFQIMFSRYYVWL